ncbi:MAG: hypothetical protein NVV73_05320 [Cellvibrionaceae bacterium]|nr:hypothetical protein [Cellvibrionaceae bacterium]
MKLVLQVAAGILLASLVVFALRLVLISAAVSGIKDITDSAVDRQKQLIAEQQEKVKEEARIKLERERQAAEKAKIEAEKARLKAQAWSKYYQDPQDCLVFQSDAHMVKCVDHKKRARTEFDRLYDLGKIR